MYIYSARAIIRIDHAFSLKDKRRVRRSIIDKLKARFNLAIAEVDTQDVHNILTLGIVVVAGEADYAFNLFQEILRFMDEHVDGDVINVAENVYIE